MKLYKFYKQGCYPCSTLSAIMRRVEIPAGIELIEIDAGEEQNKKLLEANGISKVPVLLFEDGRRLDGVKPGVVVERFLSGVQ